MEENSIYSSWQEGESGRYRGSRSPSTNRAGIFPGPPGAVLVALTAPCLQWASFQWWYRGRRQPPAAS